MLVRSVKFVTLLHKDTFAMRKKLKTVKSAVRANLRHSYTVSQKSKSARHQTPVDNFAKYWPIFIFSPLYSIRKLVIPVTRKPSWRRGKRATAVRVWRPLAKKSTANQRYAISYWWLTLTVAALLTVCEIFSGVEVENRHFRPLYCDCSSG